MPAEVRVLYDGWGLIQNPLAPDALHLQALLANLPPQVEPLLLLPEERPDWLAGPENLQVEVWATQMMTEAYRLRWEQQTLPAAARELAADLIHLTHSNAPFLNSGQVLTSPTAPIGQKDKFTGFGTRLRSALKQGSQARLGGVFWPQDLTQPPQGLSLLPLPPFVAPDFTPSRADQSEPEPPVDLPESYILYHGPPGPQHLRRVLSAWSWAAGPIGSLYPLVMLGLDQAAAKGVNDLGTELGLTESILVLPPIPPTGVPWIYRRCAALFNPVPEPPWGGSLRRALVMGKPSVAVQETWTADMVGPAAYLVPPDDTRKTGAALITLIVEEEVSNELAGAALKQAESWAGGQGVEKRLLKHYVEFFRPS